MATAKKNEVFTIDLRGANLTAKQLIDIGTALQTTVLNKLGNDSKPTLAGKLKGLDPIRGFVYDEFYKFNAKTLEKTDLKATTIAKTAPAAKVKTAIKSAPATKATKAAKTTKGGSK